MAANERLVAYRVWDAPTRWFHWINALSVLGLMLVGIRFPHDKGWTAVDPVAVHSARI